MTDATDHSSDAPRRLTVTVGGLAGTGTSTLCRLLSARLDLPYTYAGSIFREEAARRGMTLVEFNELCQQDPEVDRSLDERQLELVRAGGLLLEGRMAGWLAEEAEVDAHTVWVTCEPEERLRRIADRDGGDLDEVRATTERREASELERFLRYHGADLTDLSRYDQVLDSTSQTPDALAASVVAALRAADAPLPSDV